MLNRLYRHPICGFTLVELMIVIVVIGILASVAIPSYQNYIVQARRADAQATLMNIHLGLERWRAKNVSLTTVVTDACSTCTNTPYYNFSIYQFDEETYVLKADAQGTQASNDAECKNLTLSHAGVKGPANCWKS